jgi:hypothetical protein
MNILIKWINGAPFEHVMGCSTFMISINHFYSHMFTHIVSETVQMKPQSVSLRQFTCSWIDLGRFHGIQELETTLTISDYLKRVLYLNFSKTHRISNAESVLLINDSLDIEPELCSVDLKNI